jgi:hypothetical protein
MISTAPMRLSVREPSSRTRIRIGPSWMASPVPAAVMLTVATGGSFRIGFSYDRLVSS